MFLLSLDSLGKKTERGNSNLKKLQKEPVGLKGIVVGQGDTYEEALSDVKSAIRFHIETFGEAALEVKDKSINTSDNLYAGKYIKR